MILLPLVRLFCRLVRSFWILQIFMSSRRMFMLTCNKKSWLLEEKYIVIKVCNATNSHLLIIMKSNRLTQLFEMSIIDVYYYMVILKINWGSGI